MSNAMLGVKNTTNLNVGQWIDKMPCFCASTTIYRSNCITRKNGSFRGYDGAFAPS
jgi:hypothetical protein